jgi:predicted GIY-YIG superfamily endonuclease
MKPPVGTTYLVHFARPIGNVGNRRAMAQHYLGWSADAEARLERHGGGWGAKILAAVAERGIPFAIVRTWPRTTRATERRLKGRKRARDLCPVCQHAE